MKAHLLTFLVTLAVVFGGCIAGQASADPKNATGVDPTALPPPSENEGRIVGTVTDDSLLPFEGAMVGLINANPPVSAATDAEGQFVLAGLIPGKYSIGVQKLGFESAGRSVDVLAGESLEANFVLPAIPVSGPSRLFTIIGEGYFACGAATDVIDWGNLHACVWDNHKPNISFEAPKADLKGIMQEVVWQQSSGVTSQLLSVSLVYKQACTPFCENEATFNDEEGRSPVRMYTEADEAIKKVKEDPMPLKSVTFPADGEEHAVIVFQQRMTHYITMFWGEGSSIEAFTAIPDQ